ncbi:hypothetical protein FKW77_000924 [Venturia effusa]|uniref:Uncharacterized protein n=1 Tax=Venturia effusa TaxID=50376 RepID=A0A517LRF6_9PEZI|nr:hypothetical protein FKW77_000924 [Venturia effusa]
MTKRKRDTDFPPDQSKGESKGEKGSRCTIDESALNNADDQIYPTTISSLSTIHDVYAGFAWDTDDRFKKVNKSRFFHSAYFHRIFHSQTQKERDYFMDDYLQYNLALVHHEYKPKIRALEAELESYKERLYAANEDNEELRGNVDRWTSEIEALQQLVLTHKKTIAQAEADREYAEVVSEDLEDQLKVQMAANAALRNDLHEEKELVRVLASSNTKFLADSDAIQRDMMGYLESYEATDHATQTDTSTYQEEAKSELVVRSTSLTSRSLQALPQSTDLDINKEDSPTLPLMESMAASVNDIEAIKAGLTRSASDVSRLDKELAMLSGIAGRISRTMNPHPKPSKQQAKALKLNSVQSTPILPRNLNFPPLQDPEPTLLQSPEATMLQSPEATLLQSPEATPLLAGQTAAVLPVPTITPQEPRVNQTAMPKRGSRLRALTLWLRKPFYYLLLATSYSIFIFVFYSIAWTFWIHAKNPDFMCELVHAVELPNLRLRFFLEFFLLEPATFGRFKVLEGLWVYVSQHWLKKVAAKTQTCPAPR